MMPRVFLAVAAGCAVLFVGAMALTWAIPSRPSERPFCRNGGITALTTDCRRD